MEYRIEHDSLGEVRVPANHMWGAQTQRSFENFKIGHVMPKEIIRAFAILKKCAAKVNEERGALAAEKGEAIRSACDEILAGKWEGEFPLVVYQTGSGTQSNMNMNEVVAHIANRKLEQEGFVQTKPSPDDARSKLVFLTAKGRKYNEVTEELSAERLTTFYKGFTPEEQEKVCRYLKRIADNFEK